MGKRGRSISYLEWQVFRNRNRAYGAFWLRLRFAGLMLRAFGGVALVAIALSLISMFGEPGASVQEINADTLLLQTEMAPLTELPPPPPTAPKPPQKTENATQPIPVLVSSPDTLPAPPPDSLLGASDTQPDTALGFIQPLASDTERDASGGHPGGAADGLSPSGLPRAFAPDSVVELDSLPMPLNLGELRQNMPYPEGARVAGISGEVVLRVLVDAQGQYARHVIVRSPHSVLTQVVARQIGKLRCSPGLYKGRGVPVWLTLTFEFRLLESR